jgi:hypothetical protein
MATEIVVQSPPQAADPLVMAIGDTGRPELCRRSETVEIPEIPLAQGNLAIPATLRFLARKGESPVAKRLLKVQKPNTRTNRTPFVCVTFETEPYTRYTIGKKRVTGTVRSCAVRNTSDCDDVIFSRLMPLEKRRIRAAVGRV